jgi:hypothetical protein
MMQRIRNIEIALQQCFPAKQVVALKQAFGYPMGVYKTAAQTVSASTAFVNDDTLWTELYGAGRHRVTFTMATPGMTAAGGLKLQLVADQGLTVTSVTMAAYYYLTGVAPAVTPITALSSAVNGGTTNAWTNVIITGTVDVANGGVLQLQWAQQAASGSTTVGLGSCIDTVMLNTPPAP